MSTLHDKGAGITAPTADKVALNAIVAKLEDARRLLDIALVAGAAGPYTPRPIFGPASQAQVLISRALAEFMAAGLEDP